MEQQSNSPNSAAVIWPVVHHERQTLITDLEKLDPEQWLTPSLCAEWDIHDVLAHLVDSAKTTRFSFASRLLRAKLDFDRATAIGVEKEKTGDPARTLAKFREVASSTDTPPGSLASRLVEQYIHSEDIRRPLGIESSYDPVQVVTALNYQIKTTKKIGGSQELAKGFRVVVTDADYQFGEGLELHGTALTLLRAFSWRGVSADDLTGPGAPAYFAARAEQDSI